MRVLVVGGAGYVGSHTAHALRRSGFEVLIYDNLSTGHASLARGFDLVQGEIADIGRLARAVYRTDAVLHFAASACVHESMVEPRKYFRNNVESALSLLNTCMSCGIKTLVFSSSCAVYGVPAMIPIPDSAARMPVNPYGVSKLFFEHALEAYDNATPRYVTSMQREPIQAGCWVNCIPSKPAWCRSPFRPPSGTVTTCPYSAMTIPRLTAPASVIMYTSATWLRHTFRRYNTF